MIEIKTSNEKKDGFELSVHIEGDGIAVCSQLISIFNRIYENNPKLFETALVLSKYTKDHT